MKRKDHKHVPARHLALCGHKADLEGNRPVARLMITGVIIFMGVFPGWTGNVLADDAAPAFEPARVGWTKAKLKASKLFVSMKVNVQIDTRDLPEISDQLFLPPIGEPVTASGDIVALLYRSEGLGRESNTELLLDAGNGGSIQRSSRDTGKRKRLRWYRFTDIGAYRWTRRPGPGEEERAPDRWSDRSEELRRYPEPLPAEPVTEASALIYLVAASDLEKPGDRFSVLGYSSSSEALHRVEVVAVKAGKVDVNYDVRTTGGKQKLRGETTPLRVRITGRPLDETDGEAFELLGLHDIELSIDPQTRAPLELSGRVPVFGRVIFRLDDVTMRDPATAPRDPS